MVILLADRWREAPVAIGLAHRGTAVIEVFATRDGATWSIVATSPDGRSCLLTTGEHWQAIAPGTGRVL